MMAVNGIVTFLHNFKASDVVDIIIIVAFIYAMVVWFKTSRARFMLFGMVILSIVYIVASAFGLYLTTKVFQAFFAIFLIMFVVIFQEDIRRFFERIAVFSIVPRGKDNADYPQTADILAAALSTLARNKIGALVVLRGKDPLGRFIDAGINMDAVISKSLIESLFDPHVPTHDGAIVIDGNRIVEYGSHLPLSTNISQISRYGTRHAAALGLAERTDSLCLVVSEERGTITLAQEGRVCELKSQQEVSASINKFYNLKIPPHKKAAIRRTLRANIKEKLIAVVAAVAIWVFFGQRNELIPSGFSRAG